MDQSPWRIPTASPENGSRRTCSRAHRGTAGHDTGTLRTGRLAEVAGGAWGLRPRKAPLGARAQSAAGCCRADCHSLRRLHPASRFVRAPMDDSSHEKGDSPLFQRVNSKHVTHDAPPYVDFYTGERLAMCGTASGGEASRSST